MRTCAAVIAALLVTAGCGAAPAPSASAGPRIVEVAMRDFGFAPSTITLRAGEKVTFRFTNTGIVEHEFMAGLRPTPGKGYGEDWIAKAATSLPTHTHPGEEHLGEGVRVGPDWFASLTVVVPAEPGEYEFGCFVEGHYERGMKGTLVVSR